MQRSRLRAFLPVFLVAASVAAGAQAAPSPRATVTGSVPSWATSANFKGAASTSASVGFRVYLPWRGNAAATAAAVSTPGSASYGQYLTPAQFRQQFAPSQADVNAVKNWLTSQGFTVDYVPTNNHYVAAEGTVAQAAAAFGVTFGEYNVDGLTLRSPSSQISVPASLGGIVNAVVGLDESSALVHYDHADAPPTPGFRNAPPCSAYWGQLLATSLPKFNNTTLPYAPCGYDATMLRSAYGMGDAFTTKLNGAGQTVAIIDAYASPTILQDANQYSDLHGLPEFQGAQFQQVIAPGTLRHPEEGNLQDPQGWYVEETLDVEAVHSMAPAANVVFVGAANAFRDLDAALNNVVDKHLAQIVTNSYGFPTEFLPQGYINSEENTLVQAAATGIGVYFSSGDDGDETQFVGYRTADYPASSPYVTSVGGTSLGIGSSNNYLWETYWGTDKYTLSNGSWAPNGFWYGGGGGESRIFGEPSYQAGIADAFAGFWGGNNRVEPDVSLVGDPTTGILMGETQTFPDGTAYGEFREGGTSLSSPLFAGIMAVADQAAGHAHGFANPALYSLYGTSAYRDVAPNRSIVGAVRVDYNNGLDASAGTTTSVRTIGDTESLTSKRGFDDANGLGTPNGQAFISALAK